MSACNCYKTAILFIGGFTQRRGHGNGLYTAFQRTYRRHGGRETLVEYFPWLVSPAEIAAELRGHDMRTLSETGQRMQVVIAGYSFGGATAAAICREFDHQARTDAINVQTLVLIDPIARWLGRLGWTRAALPATIRVSPNVRRTIWFRQENRRFRLRAPFFFPSSHRVAVPRNRLLDGPYTLPHEHADIEHADQVQSMLDLVVHQTLSGRNP